MVDQGRRLAARAPRVPSKEDTPTLRPVGAVSALPWTRPLPIDASQPRRPTGWTLAAARVWGTAAGTEPWGGIWHQADMPRTASGSTNADPTRLRA